MQAHCHTVSLCWACPALIHAGQQPDLPWLAPLQLQHDMGKVLYKLPNQNEFACRSRSPLGRYSFVCSRRDHSPVQTDGCHSRCSRQYSLLSGMYANSQVSKLAPVMGIVYGCHMPAMQGRVPHHEPPVCYCCLLFMSLYNVKPECRQLINLVPASCGCRCC